MSSSKGKLSRDDYRKQKELEAARKAGTAPPETDASGNMINPHIPQFMSQAPWYLDSGQPGLAHQRKQAEEKSDAWYARGQRAGTGAKKYRKGACENCGAMTHKTKACMERPRKRGAKWTNKGIMADEVVQDLKLSYEAKRDRWNGYDPEEHKKTIREWEMVEEARRKRKAEALDKGEDAEVENQGGTRNLRIREDTAKYLRNLDPDSAYYDPKTRSMREDPHAGQAAQSAYKGDNFVRFSGDALKVAQMEVFAWEASERGNASVHFQANPTQAAMAHSEFQHKKGARKQSAQSAVLDKYGGEEHLVRPPRSLLEQEERFVEYSRAGQPVVPSQEEQSSLGVSRYREDVFPGNHHAVFGSWWSDGQWGYRCCRQTMRNSYCTARKDSK
ncbi:mRNA splicing protein [Linderina pennispora]|nr:mRNA splicing protein [Linderina pennispora]